MGLPSGYVPIKDAESAGSRGSFAGIIVDYKTPVKSRGSDWVLEFTIQDDFESGAVGSGPSTISARIFRSNPKDFPEINTIGDLVLARDFKINKWKHRLDLLSSTQWGSTILYFPAKEVPSLENIQAYTKGTAKLKPRHGPMTGHPNVVEQVIIIQLKHQAAPYFGKIQSQPPTIVHNFSASSHEKLSLVRDLQLSKFSDIRAQVVKIYQADAASVDLYVTDYTSNPALFLYEDPNDTDGFGAYHQSNWLGPYGQLTLQVRLYGTNVQWVLDELKEGDFAFLKNVHIKLSGLNKMEGAIHEDRMHPGQVDISSLMNKDDINEIEERKSAYEQKRSNGKDALSRLHAPKKASAKASAAKKEKKKEARRLEKEREQRELEVFANEQAVVRAGMNPNIRASNPDLEISTVEEIVNNPKLKGMERGTEILLPFVNSKARAHLRIVDFYPNLEDFTHCEADVEWNTDINNPNAKSSISRSDKWEWAFILLVEDAEVEVPAGEEPERFRLVVAGNDADFLIKEKPVDLRQHEKKLNLLEEKLFILWGNLAELKRELVPQGIEFPLPYGDKRLKNQPFECCVAEYGVELDGGQYERLHRMFETTIMS